MLQIRSLPDLAVEAKLSLEARAVGSLADGTLLALAADKLCTLAPGAHEPTCRPKLTIMSERLGWVWSDAAGSLWMLEGDVARRCIIEGAKVRVTGSVKLSVGAGAILAPLGDGSVVWGENMTLHHATTTKTTEWFSHGGGILHAAPGAPGHVWISLDNQTLILIKAGATLELVRTIHSERILSLSATPTHVATVVGHPAHLVVRDAQGAQILDRPLPTDARAFHVALSPFAPLVAVGGDGELTVWTLDGKKLGKTP